MKVRSKVLVFVTFAVGAVAFGAPADAMPIQAPLLLQDAAAPTVETVQWRRGWRGRSSRGWGPGLAAGAIIGGAIIASQPWRYGYYDDYAYSRGYAYEYSPDYSYEERDVSYCVRRFRSYDPSSGTYLGYDGRRHPCP